MPASGQAVRTIRPAVPARSATGFNAAGNAVDVSPVSASGASHTVRCFVDGTRRFVSQTTWSGVPAGYTPTGLRVTWVASAYFWLVQAGHRAQVNARVSYSLDGGRSWLALEEPFERAEAATGTRGYGRQLREARVPLSKTQPSASIRVRATLTVQLNDCGPSGDATLSQANGSMQVTDIAVDVEPVRRR